MKLQIIKNMGLRWTVYRTQYEIKKKFGYLERAYPAQSHKDIDIGLNLDKSLVKQHLRKGLSHLSLSYNYTGQEKATLLKRADDILSSKFYYFNNKKYSFKNWNYSPKTNKYAHNDLHWSKISDFNSDFGDIKWIWELNRFTFAYDLSRAYICTGKDRYVEKFWKLFESFVMHNPLEIGVNYKCSQEMSFRTNAWLFALFHFIDHSASSEHRIKLILEYITHYLDHIYKHINFSVEAVKNNHSISEATTLTVMGNTLKFLPRSKKYYKKGIKVLQKEIGWQIKSDGSFIQHSHNYHRLVLQNLSWYLLSAISLKQKVPEVIREKAQLSINYFMNVVSDEGKVSNYGMNDGSYIMPLTEKSYEDYRPVLQCLNYQLNQELLFEDVSVNEILYLFNKDTKSKKLTYSNVDKRNIVINKYGGYHILRYGEFRVFVKSKSYKDRPAQADMNHVDIWYGNQCIFGDAGTYSYNDSDKVLNYFNGTFSHNTVLLNDSNQMEKGNRFIWYNWSKSKKPKVVENTNSIDIIVELINYNEYRHIRHINVSRYEVIISDQIINENEFDTDVKLQWLTELNSKKSKENTVSIDDNKWKLKISTDLEGTIQIYKGSKNDFRGWVSSTYGEKHPANQVIYHTNSSSKSILIRSIISKL